MVTLNKVEKTNENKDKFFYKIDDHSKSEFLGEILVSGFSNDDVKIFGEVYKKAKQIGANTFDLKPIENVDGSFQAFVDEFTTKSLSVFGSGWSWLQPDLSIIITPNQDNPLTLGKDAPILGLDVWEHAYYLDYKNKRDDYINAWWNVVNWAKVAELYDKN